MPVATAQQTVKAEIAYTYATVPCFNIWHFRITEGFLSLPSLTDLSELINDWMVDMLMPTLTDQLVYVRNKITSEDLSSPLEYEGAIVAQPGLVGTPGAPINVAAKVNFISGLIGRSFKGRTYIPGVPEVDVDTRTLGATFATELQAAFEALAIAVGTINYEHVIVSRQQDNAPINPAQVTAVIGYSVSPRVGTMGRRVDN